MKDFSQESVSKLSTNNEDSLRSNMNPLFVSQQGVYDQLNGYFDEQDLQKKTIQEGREILGDSALSLTDEQVYDLVNEVQFLVDTWLEEYEKKVFDGKTLDEILQHDL